MLKYLKVEIERIFLTTLVDKKIKYILKCLKIIHSNKNGDKNQISIDSHPRSYHLQLIKVQIELVQ